MSFYYEACTWCQHKNFCYAANLLQKDRTLNDIMMGCRYYVHVDNERPSSSTPEEPPRRDVAEDAMDISAAIHAAAGDKIAEPELVPGQACHICGKEGEAYICSQCGAFVCPDCTTETLDGKVLCPDCF